ncbi:MAG: hypothetical protein ACP5PV_10120 [Methanothrix sp.]
MEDILVAAGVGIVLLLIDKFALRKLYPESYISDALLSTDRLITYFIGMDLFIFYLFWSSAETGDYLWVWGYGALQLPFLIVMGVLFGHREKCILSHHNPLRPPLKPPNS